MKIQNLHVVVERGTPKSTNYLWILSLNYEGRSVWDPHATQLSEHLLNKEPVIPRLRGAVAQRRRRRERAQPRATPGVSSHALGLRPGGPKELNRKSFAPSGLCSSRMTGPSACALGYNLSRLRRCWATAPAKAGGRDINKNVAKPPLMERTGRLVQLPINR